MRRRLDLAASLITRRPVLPRRADHRPGPGQPRPGLDQIIRSLAADGATVLLTTQYLEEADQLASRIAVIDHGTVVAEGTPGELKASAGTGTLRIRLADPAHRPRARQMLTRLLGLTVQAEADPADAGPPRAAGRTASEQAAALAELARAGIVGRSSPSASPASTRYSSPSPATRRDRR